jgi:transposase
MQNITTIGLDIAKESFAVHGCDASGKTVLKKVLTRDEVLGWFKQAPQGCLVGLEACGSAHYWAREIGALGHEVRLIPAARVKAFVPRQKNDAADAQAISTAVRQPEMRFVPVKSLEQQSLLMLHKTRDLLSRQRVDIMNALRGHFAETGVVVATGPKHVATLVERVKKEEKAPNATAPGTMPRQMLAAMRSLVSSLEALNEEIAALDREIVAALKANEMARRLVTIPGIGPFIATLIAGLYRDVKAFANGRAFAASLGLAPAQHSTGGEARLRGISKMGNRDVRRLLVVGATAVLWRVRKAKTHKSKLAQWAAALCAKKPFRLASVALANKLARIIWALIARGGSFRTEAPDSAAA